MAIGMKRAAYFVDSFLPPSEIFMVEQARHLTKYVAKFIAMRRHRSKAARQHPMRVDCLSDSSHGRMSAAKLKAFGWSDSLLCNLTRDTTLLHAQFGKNGYLAWAIAKRAGLPFVTTFHGYDATFVGNPLSAGGFNQRLFFWRGRRQMASAGLNCIAVSNFIRARLIKLGFPQHKVFRQYIGIDTDLFCPRQGLDRVKHRVMCVSRFVEYKGHRFVVEALAQLARSGMPIELIMVGQGPLRDEIERSARRNLPKVTILDDQTQQEIASLLRSAQLCIHGSYRTPTGHAEALGLAMLEAQAVGTPVVAFDSGGVGEALISGNTGFLAPEKDVRAMSALAAALLTDSQKWNAFSRAGIDFVRAKFDIRKCSQELEELYDHIVKEHRDEKRQ